MFKHKVLSVLGAFAILSIAAFASASPTLWIDDGSGVLGTVDVATGSASVVGNMGVIMTDIAFSPTGTLYGISFNSLYTINTTTAAATLIGGLGLTGANALVFGSDGTLYTAAFNTTNLYTVSTLTGAAISIGNIGFNSAGDLAFNGGNFYLSSTTNQLVSINLSGTVSGSAVGPLGFFNVFGLATADNGTLYGVSGQNVFSVNTATGAGTLVSSYAGQALLSANGTSFFTEAGAGGGGGTPAVPEPATILLLGAGVIGLASLKQKLS